MDPRPKVEQMRTRDINLVLILVGLNILAQFAGTYFFLGHR